MFQVSLLRLFLIIAIFSFTIIGCGGSEEAISEDEMVTDLGIEEESTGEESTEEPTESVQQEEPVEQPVEQPAEQPVQNEGPSTDQLQTEIDVIKSENMNLKDENSSLQMTNKELAKKISDLEAANAALAASPINTQPARTATRIDSRPAPGKSSQEQIRAYESAVSIVRSKNYQGAISELENLLNTGIKDDFADNCHYWIGESKFQMRDFSSAIQHFQQVQNYRYSEKRDDAQLMIAQSYERLGDRQKAREEYQKLVDMYPTSEYVKRARAKVR